MQEEKGLSEGAARVDESTETKGKRGQKKACRWVCALLIVALLAGNVAQFLWNRKLSADNEALNQTYAVDFLRSNSITLARFYQMQEDGESFIVNVSRPNCGTCRQFEAEYHEILDRNDLSETVYYLNVAELRKDEEAWVAFKETHNIQGTPSYLFFRDGALVASTGWTPDDGLDGAAVEQWLAEQAAALHAETER